MAGHQSNIAIHIFAYLVVALFALNVVAPVVQAGGKSNKLVVQEQDLILNAPNDFSWTTLQNIANSSDYKYLDYNLTWIPFLQNNTDITGVLVHNLFPPATWEMNLTNYNLSLGSYFRVLPQDIISGASETWFRIPVTDIPSTATISMTVYRVSDPVAFNMSFDGFADPDFYAGHNVQLVYDITLDPLQSNVTGTTSLIPPSNAWVNYKRWQNISVIGANDTLHYNFTYVKACFGLFPNEYYFIEFDITTLASSSMKLLLSSGDFGSDDKNNTWFWMNEHEYYLPLDLDTSFICTQGMSNGITGIGARETYPIASVWPKFVFNSSIPIKRIINTPVGYVFFNLIIPFFVNLTYSDHTKISLRVYFCNSTDSDSYFHKDNPLFFGYTNGAYDFDMFSVNLTPHIGEFIDHIRVTMILEDNVSMSALAPSPAIKFWGTQMPYNETVAGYTDLYWYGQVGSDLHWRMFEKQWFVPFGYYSLDNSYWVNTNQPIITVPANNPITYSKIDEVIQKFKLLVFKNVTSGLHYGADFLLSKEFWGEVGSGLKQLLDVEKAIWAGFAKAAWWVIEHTSLGLMLSQWYWLWRYWKHEAEAHNTTIPDMMGLLWNKLKAIGQWVWHTIQMVFDALEWFTYWAVREIYAFSMAIVYIVNVFGVISINSALLAVVRTGNGKDFVKAFRAGWKFVFAIISLLLSLAIMAISIVGAVVPF